MLVCAALDAATTFRVIKESYISAVLQGENDLQLPALTEDCCSLETRVFTAQNKSTFISPCVCL